MELVPSLGRADRAVVNWSSAKHVYVPEPRKAHRARFTYAPMQPGAPAQVTARVCPVVNGPSDASGLVRATHGAVGGGVGGPVGKGVPAVGVNVAVGARVGAAVGAEDGRRVSAMTDREAPSTLTAMPKLAPTTSAKAVDDRDARMDPAHCAGEL